jgi:hypothetical protein
MACFTITLFPIPTLEAEFRLTFPTHTLYKSGEDEFRK